MNFSDYKKFLIQNYPSLGGFLKDQKQLPPSFLEIIPLSSEVFQSMEQVIKTLFFLKKDKKYLENLFKKSPNFIPKESQQDSVLMAYDFHIDEQNLPRLIEVNTNASGFLFVNSLYQFHNWGHQESLKNLKNSFEEEWKTYQSINKDSFLKPKKVVLIDKNPPEQKMFMEFLMYKDFFKSMGWPLEICESSSLKIKGDVLMTPQGEKVDFIYNRSADFYFEEHPHLLKAYQSNMCCINPHPREYFLLSDKNRLCSWFIGTEKDSLLKPIKKYLIPSFVLSADQKEKKEEVWKNKKRYFFKISRGHGGKIAYRGSNLTRKKFELLCEQNCVFQEYIPPSLWTDAEGEKWKLDFRVFVYRDQIQQLAARCYKGQITNFKETGSGWALVKEG